MVKIRHLYPRQVLSFLIPLTLLLTAAVAQAAGFRFIEAPAGPDGPALTGAMWSPCSAAPGEIDLGNATPAGGERLSDRQRQAPACRHLARQGRFLSWPSRYRGDACGCRLCRGRHQSSRRHGLRYEPFRRSVGFHRAAERHQTAQADGGNVSGTALYRRPLVPARQPRRG